MYYYVLLLLAIALEVQNVKKKKKKKGTSHKRIATDRHGFSQNVVLFFFYTRRSIKVARNEVENASFAQRSAHRDSRIWRPELIEPAAECKRRARGRRRTFKSAYHDPQILPQCKISSNYPL